MTRAARAGHRAPGRPLGPADRRRAVAGRPAPHRQRPARLEPGLVRRRRRDQHRRDARSWPLRWHLLLRRARPPRAGPLVALRDATRSRCCSVRCCRPPSAATRCARSTSRGAPGARAEAVSSVLVDRVVGLAALGALAAAGALAGGSRHRRAARRVALELGVGRRHAARRRGPVLAPRCAAAAAAARRSRARCASRRRCARSTTRCTPIAGIRGALAWVFVLGVRRAGHARDLDRLPGARAWASTSASRRCSCSARCSSSSRSCPVSLNGDRPARGDVRRRARAARASAREDAFALGLAFFAVGVLTGAPRRPGARCAGRSPAGRGRTGESTVQ